MNWINIVCFIVGTSCWLDLGCFGFYYWWTKRYPFNRDAFNTMLFVFFMGPINFLIGYFIENHVNKKLDKM